MSAPLYEIKEEILQLQNIEADGDESLEEAIHNSLDDLQLSFNEKVDNIVKMNLSIDGDINLIKNEIKRLQERKSAFINKQASMKKYVIKNMNELDKKSIKTPLFSVSCVAGRDRVVVDDEGLIPSDFINIAVTETPDKKALLKALKENDISGCHIEKSENTLRIK